MIKNHSIYYPLYTDRDHFIILVTGGRGCEHPDTEVMMADLTVRKIKDIHIGDYVMGDDFRPRMVMNTVSGRSEMYRVRQNGAEDYIVNGDHYLVLRRSKGAVNSKMLASGEKITYDRYPDYGKEIEIKVEDYIQKSRKFKDSYLGYRAGSVPFPESEVPIDPYLLGLWMGDGTATLPAITNPEPEIAEWLRAYCESHGQNLTGNWTKGASHFRISGDGSIGGNDFLNRLREYGLIGDKHIPQCYISNSERVRLELLAGLLDSDGHLRGHVYEITQKEERMARQIKYVADTLGLRTSIHSKRAVCNSKDCGIVWRVMISGELWRIPCRVERKRVEPYKRSRDWGVTQIAVEPIGEGDWCGIQIDGNHRYLAADGTVKRNSGKSFGVATFIERLTFEMKKRGMTGAAADRIVHNILYSRYTMVSAAMSVIPEFMEKVEADGTARYFSATRTDVINRMTGSKIMFRGLRTSSGNQTARLKSIHGITTFVCDEAEEWTSEREFETIAFSIRQPGIQNRIIVMMNPTDSNHFIYQKYIKDTHELQMFDGVPVQVSTHPQVLHIHTTYLDNVEHLSEEFVRAAREMKENDPEKYAHIFMGQWADVAEGAVYKKWGVVNEFPANARKVALGVDWGYTHDPSAAVKCGVVGNDLYLDEIFYKTGMGITELAEAMRKEGLFVYADSADPRLIDEIANRGVIVYPVAKPAGSIVAGIERVKDFDNVFVTERSVNLQQELRNYVWAKDKNGVYINIPEDHDNHACFTADTTVATLRGEVPIAEVRVGDMILTDVGARRVTAVFDNGVRETVTADIDLGDLRVRMTATPDHRIWTTHGYVRLDSLGEGMTVMAGRSGETGFRGVRKVTIEERGQQNVYNIEVEERHCYFANGILVSNCDAFRYYVNGHILGQIVKPRRVDPDRLGIF